MISVDLSSQSDYQNQTSFLYKNSVKKDIPLTVPNMGLKDSKAYSTHT